jgi:hypothetical protein
MYVSKVDNSILIVGFELQGLLKFDIGRLQVALAQRDNAHFIVIISLFLLVLNGYRGATVQGNEQHEKCAC